MTNNIIQGFVFKGGGGENSCARCSSLDGTIYANAEDLPEIPLHPNCKCHYEAIISTKEQEKLMQKLEKHFKYLTITKQDLINLQDRLTKLKENGVKNKQIANNDKEVVFEKYNVIIEETNNILEVINIFFKNYLDMREAWLSGADKYFHAKANAQAAQKGEVGESVARFIGGAREITEITKNIYKKHYQKEAVTEKDLKKWLEDALNDIEANNYGLKQGRENPNANPKDLVEKYRVEELSDKY